jgi:hypothetical protein
MKTDDRSELPYTLIRIDTHVKRWASTGLLTGPTP